MNETYTCRFHQGRSDLINKSKLYEVEIQRNTSHCLTLQTFSRDDCLVFARHNYGMCRKSPSDGFRFMNDNR